MKRFHDFSAGDRVVTISGTFTGTVTNAPSFSGIVLVDWDDKKENPLPAHTWHKFIRKVLP